MSTYLDLIAVITSLPSGNPVQVTVQWCSQYGLIVTPGRVKEWGKLLHSEYISLGLIYLGKTSDNLHHYEKI